MFGRANRNGLAVRGGLRLAPAKGRILAARLHVSLAVNRELIKTAAAETRPIWDREEPRLR
jgi:hypothetical protein